MEGKETMGLDTRLLGSWLDENGIHLIKQDPDTNDGLWYLTGPAAGYSMPDAETLLYPLHDSRLYKRADSTANQTIVGHWRHDKDPAIADDAGEEVIFRKDGLYVDFWDGESLFYNGSYTDIDKPSGKQLSIIEYRARLETESNSYVLAAVWDFTQEGTFVFGVDSSGSKVVRLTPSDGTPSWGLVDYAGQQRLPDPATAGVVRRDAIRKRRAG
jgi:hypothetical protein